MHLHFMQRNFKNSKKVRVIGEIRWNVIYSSEWQEIFWKYAKWNENIWKNTTYRLCIVRFRITCPSNVYNHKLTLLLPNV